MDCSRNGWCSRCAAINFSALFPEYLRSIQLHHPSTWKPRECEACDFFLRCSESISTNTPGPRGPYSLERTFLAPVGILNVVDRALPAAVSSANDSFCQIKEGPGHAQRRIIVRSRVDLGSKINITPSKIDWHLVNEWLRADTKNSQREVQKKASRDSTNISLDLSPDRSSLLTVIDCQSRELVQISPGKEYVTLSYVWGSGGPALEPYRPAGTSSRELPSTVEDSLLACLKLGYPYLWVDRYCIPQTDSPERHRLIQKMDEVYANSTLTIVACAGKDPQHGLPGVTRLRGALPTVLVKDSWYLQALPMVQDIHQSVWGSRGWTYQEALLSQRRLYFTDSQLYFEGFQSVQCEWLARSVGDFARDTLRTKDVPWIFPTFKYFEDPAQIYKCIAGYSSRELSFESDALNAMSGIFAVFERCHQVRHIWGMPYLSRYEGCRTTGELSQPSLWHSLEFSTYSTFVRRKEFPSWSWLGWKGVAFWSPIKFPYQAAWYLNISPEMMSGSVLSWSDYEKNYHIYARNHDRISRFIHVEAYMSPIVQVTIAGKDSEEYPFHPNMAIFELAYGIKLYAPEEGSVVNRIKDDMPRFLLMHMPRWHNMLNDFHLLLEDHGDHWERVHLIRARCEECYNPRESYLRHLDGHAGCNRFGPPGFLRTIRLG
jgi:hypothetical protein